MDIQCPSARRMCIVAFSVSRSDGFNARISSHSGTVSLTLFMRTVARAYRAYKCISPTINKTSISPYLGQVLLQHFIALLDRRLVRARVENIQV